MLTKSALGLFVVTFSSLVFATSAPDSGASGDARRNLATALYDMGAVDMDLGVGGFYRGLYNVECHWSEGAYRFCNASTVKGGSQDIKNATSASVVLGQTLATQIVGAFGAFSIKADVVACNTVGDRCLIKGIKLNEF